MRLPDGGVHGVGEVHHCNAVKWNFVVILKGAGGRLVRFIVAPINKHGYLKHLLLWLQFSKQPMPCRVLGFSSGTTTEKKNTSYNMKQRPMILMGWWKMEMKKIEKSSRSLLRFPNTKKCVEECRGA